MNSDPGELGRVFPVGVTERRRLFAAICGAVNFRLPRSTERSLPGNRLWSSKATCLLTYCKRSGESYRISITLGYAANVHPVFPSNSCYNLLEIDSILASYNQTPFLFNLIIINFAANSRKNFIIPAHFW